MSRSGYIEDYGCDDILELGRYRGRVASAIRGKRGQSFLKELAREMDAMPTKELISNELVNAKGQCCTIGVVCKARGLDVEGINAEYPEEVGASVGIHEVMAAEIEYENDQDFDYVISETPAERWVRMREWVEGKIKRDP